MGKTRHITLPAGFIAAGVKCGIKASGKEDLALIVGEARLAAAVLTTSNQVVGAPVLWCRKILPAGAGWVRGIVINSGNSNVCTGRRGAKDAQSMATRAGRTVGAGKEEMLVASTGIIGRPLPMANIRSGIDAAAAALARGCDRAVARAIMTTDTKEKSAVVRTRIGGDTVTIAGIAKGAGMIAPQLATMIAVVTTDARIAPRPLRSAFKAAAAGSFNALTIDSDQSTSDTAVVLASGQASKRIRPSSADERKFAAALSEVCLALTKAMARDGEGATKLIRIRVTGARSPADAKTAAKAVANSPLVKCAVHGADPNWGRIVVAVGKSRAKVKPEKLSVTIGGVAVFAAGMPRKASAAALAKHLAGDTVTIDVNLGLGKGQFTAYTCDLSREYISINADYHT